MVAFVRNGILEFSLALALQVKEDRWAASLFGPNKAVAVRLDLWKYTGVDAGSIGEPYKYTRSKRLHIRSFHGCKSLLPFLLSCQSNGRK